ncbi:MAG TPA: tetratricopeptide repeat protein [Steroidobacteraceae bacterium]|nr:tetratricopeptide repeat protein [Steroidobacteraceae bacterium]
MTPLFASLLLWAAAEPPAAEPPAPEAQSPPTDTASGQTEQTEPPATVAEPPDSRLEAYEQFRALYDAGRYQDALPLAHQVVELSAQDGEHERELPIAYNNLGATQLQLADFKAAEASYHKSLELLETTQGISSRRLVVPLAGLGAAYAAQDQHDLAAVFLARALAVSRRADGLFNLAQLPLVEQLGDSLYALADYGGAERERLYALTIAEQNYGYGDPRTLPALNSLARFYEGLREYSSARSMYMRIRDAAGTEGGGLSAESIRALLGIARTHRLQYMVDPASVESQLPEREERITDPMDTIFKQPRVLIPVTERGGLRAARSALELLRAASDPPPQLMIDALTELGDWYQTTSRQSLANPCYQEALAVIAAHPERALVNPMAAPRLVFYRPPLSAMRGLNAMGGEYRIRRTVFEFTVTASGAPENITIVESDMTEGQMVQSRRALSRAVYSPRFENGEPAASDGVRFTSEWSELIQPGDTADTPQAAQSG